MKGRLAANSDSVSRRTVLQGVGGASTAGLLASTIGSAREETVNLVGMTYDSLTHEFQRRATGSIDYEDDGSISGQLQIAGFSIDFGDPQPIPSRSVGGEPQYNIKRTAPGFKKDGLPLKLSFTALGGRVVGTMTRPSGDYGKIGFTLLEPGVSAPDVGEENLVRDMKSSLMGGGSGVTPEGMDQQPEIPNEGVPISTGFRTIAGGVQNG